MDKKKIILFLMVLLLMVMIDGISDKDCIFREVEMTRKIIGETRFYSIAECDPGAETCGYMAANGTWYAEKHTSTITGPKIEKFNTTVCYIRP